ncbi:MAG: hypothetical protein ACETVR_01070, partial [Candidatus Bathyarchaeia archaeon]
EERAEDYQYEIEDYDIDSFRLWYSRVFVPDWRKLERIFKTYDTLIRDEGPLDPEKRGALLRELGETSS